MKKSTSILAVISITAAAILTLTSCSKEDLGLDGKAECNGVEFNDKTHFCYANTIYQKCSNKEYSPDVQTCDANGKIVGGDPNVPSDTQCKDQNRILFCEYEGGCYNLDSRYTEPAGQTCAQIISNCNQWGKLYTGVTGLNESNGWGEGLKCAAKGGTLVNSTNNPNNSSGAILWDFASGKKDVKLTNNSNDNGWFWGYVFLPETNGWVSNRDASLDDPNENFSQNFTANGLQVGLIANAPPPDKNTGAGFGFNWNLVGTANISDLGGLCLVYAMEGTAANFEIELGVDEEIAEQYDWGTFLYQVPTTNGKKALVNIPWSDFAPPYGTMPLATALSQSKGIHFRIETKAGQKSAQITLLQIGALNACSQPAANQNVVFLSPKAP